MHQIQFLIFARGRRGRDRMVFGFTIIYVFRS